MVCLEGRGERDDPRSTTCVVRSKPVEDLAFQQSPTSPDRRSLQKESQAQPEARVCRSRRVNLRGRTRPSEPIRSSVIMLDCNYGMPKMHELYLRREGGSGLDILNPALINNGLLHNSPIDGASAPTRRSKGR